MDEYLEEMLSDMEGPIRHLSSELSKVRTGRASLALLDSIKVDYYGSPTPLNGVATLAVPEPRMIIVKPWDTTMIGPIEKAIGASSLGINPNNDGKLIRLVFPELTGDRRKELCRKVADMGEQTKVGVRNVRRDYNDLFKGMEKDGDITEDDLKRVLTRVQDETNGSCAKVDEVVKKKETEILSV
jgi:ribosome recycling factor